MGCRWWDVKCHAKKVGSAVKSGFKKVGEVVKDPRKIGEVVSGAVSGIKKIAPFVENIPVVGTIVKGISKADKIVDIGGKLLKGDVKGAAGELGKTALGMVPGVSQVSKGLDMANTLSGGAIPKLRYGGMAHMK